MPRKLHRRLYWRVLQPRLLSLYGAILIVGAIVPLLAAHHTTQAQLGPTATPLPVNMGGVIPATATPPNQPTATWTPQPTPAVQLQAIEFANVRAEPDTTAAQLGVIRTGENYPVTGQYGLWYQFQFPNTPGGVGWVFGELVTLSGDASAIPVLDPAALATLPPAALDATATQAILTQTPGGFLTATAQSLLAASALPAESSSGGSAAMRGAGQLLPTFTYPAGLAAVAPIAALTNAPVGEATAVPRTDLSITRDETSERVPPLLPIAILAAAGILGLAVSALRR